MNKLDPYNFFFELPLYSKILITPEIQEDFENLLTFSGFLNAYSSILKENTTYKCTKSPHFVKVNGALDFWREDTLHGRFELQCQRTFERQAIYIYIDQETGTLQKVGQYPSIADLHISKVKAYDKILNKEQLKEFTRAIGLAANGVGIGSFVYLRRIFEELISEAYLNAKDDLEIKDEDFFKLRMADRIDFLKDYLPSFLSENKSLYSILSVALHSLNENECLQYFDIVKVGIELILDEKVEAHIKAVKTQEAKKKIEALTGLLNRK